MPDLLGALAFLTVFGGARPLGKRADLAFPVVGILVGALLGVVWWVAAKYLYPLEAAVLVVAADAAFTGALHLDGLADASDGMLSTAAMSRERRLEVMKDPRAGVVGVVMLVLFSGARIAALASVRLGLVASVLSLAAIWCASRASMSLGLRVLDYARKSGIATTFTGRKRSGGAAAMAWVVVAETALPFGLLDAALSNAVEALVIVATYCLAAIAVLRYSKYRIGGYTGDVLGACGVVVETVALVVMAGRW